MNVSADARILALNPEEKTLGAGERLGASRYWQGTGSSERALWGECQGSAVYQVAIDLDDMGYRCSCPSRKFPCKHVVGLMALNLREPGTLAAAEPPEWVMSWLAKRVPKAEKPAAPGSASSAPTRQKRADDRMQRVIGGVDGLELWLADIERDGLARVQTQPPAFWERQAARLVDAQAPGLAARVRALGAIP
ncbi:MAG TPA: SWIM zinc finger family protein, partial [Chloroflexota bacterium]